MSSYVYLRAEAELWSVGFYTPAGNWAAESDHNSSAQAAQRVHFLNGGSLDLANTPRTPGPKPSYHLGDTTMTAILVGWWGFITCMAIEERADRRRDGIR